jgi:hypothetical protein
LLTMIYLKQCSHATPAQSCVSAQGCSSLSDCCWSDSSSSGCWHVPHVAKPYYLFDVAYHLHTFHCRLGMEAANVYC